MSRRTALLLVLLAVVAFLLIVTPRHPAPPAQGPVASAPRHAARPIGQPVEIKAPLGLPPVVAPADNPPTAETIALGRRLYYDPILSADNTVSCASCHEPEHGFADPEPTSTGVQKKHGTRHSPTVFNTAYLPAQFWDGRAPSLEKQAEGPVQNPVEMANTLTEVEERLNADPSYQAEFEKAFGPGPITYEMVEKAIASFERTVLSGNSPFDRWYYGHDEKAVSESVKRGFKVFTDPNKGNCATCHTVGDQYALFTDGKFHNIGVGADRQGFADQGRWDVTKNEKDRGLFKTPTLRSIVHTGPYMHDGSLKDVKQVVDFYVGGGNSNPNLDKEIHALDFLTGQERADLEAFLKSLSGEAPRDVGPPPKAKK
ncbi:MAG TPA: cytochrome c peroxidase [Terriglobales bacterium]|nr:cytochrome c peroxidase [Terriglobales bacterium]